MRQRSQNLPLRSRLGSTGPQSGWRRGFTGVRGGWIAKPTHPGILFEPLSLLFHLALHFFFLCPLLMLSFGLPDLLLCFSGAAPIASGQLPVARGRTPTIRGGAPGNQRPPKSRVCSGWVQRARAFTTSYRGPEPSQSPPCLLTHLHPRGAGWCQLQWSQAQQPKATALDLSVQELKGGTLEQGGPPNTK